MRGSEQRHLNGHNGSLLTAAHELKAPLALVRQLALQLDDPTLTNREREEYVRRIVLTSEQSLRLTTALTKTARLEDGLFTLEPLNPLHLCDDVAYELTPLFKEYGRAITVRRRARIPLVLADRDLFKRILLCFSDNALRHTDATSSVELDVRQLTGGKKVRVSVRDYGPAIGRDIYQHSRRPASSGLGLTIAQKFAETMHGTIGVTRHRDGATFYVDMQTSRQLTLL